MQLKTASEVISFAKELEEYSARFYQELAQRDIEDGETWLSFVKENRKNIIQIEMAYYGGITDALEGCFAFDINRDEFTPKTKLPPEVSYAQASDRAVEMEKKIRKFYSDAAKQSKLLMADVPRAFAMIARKRDSRISMLKSLLGESDS